MEAFYLELIFKERTIKLKKAQTDEIIESINTLVGDEYYFTYFIADSLRIYEDHVSYLKENADNIHRLEIMAKPAKEFINDLLLSADEYIERAVPELSPLTEEFYGNPKPEAWLTLDQLLGGLQWIDQLLIIVGKSVAVPSNWEEYLLISRTIQEEIRNMAEAIENEDSILIGDIINYELLPNFEALKKEINTTIDQEGIRHDLN